MELLSEHMDYLMHCPNCNSPVTLGDRYCQNCGASLDDTPPPAAPSPNPFRNLKVRWVIVWAAFCFAMTIVVVALGSLYLDADPSDPMARLIAINLLYGSMLGWIIWQFRRKGIDIWQLVGRLPPRFSWFPVIGLLLVGYAFSTGALEVVGSLISVTMPEFLQSNTIMSDSPESSATYFIVGIATAAIVGPLWEEVFIRGVLINRWGIKWGIRNAIIASAALFGITHGYDLFGAFMHGMVAAVLYIRTRTLLAPIALHAAHNTLATLLNFASLAAGEPDTGSIAGDIESLVLGLALLTPTLPILVWYICKNWPSHYEPLPYQASGVGSFPADRAADAED
ncbi:MAG: CPBP family glutamic-type intramembrane protease [Chloroflexi bacterium]|nr:CPBP family glutamic-type intramembrane protease [Chloroflexota bacterium]MCY3938022.1 CPBP family glutamic-type intramembrane protease [Chloroflexota bacterium]